MGEEVWISDAEWLVMDALWTLGRATPGEVIAHLAGTTTWNHRTIRTLLRRLLDKGFVKRVEQAGTVVYQPAVRRADCVRREGRTFLERVFRGDANSLLLHFAREARLSPDKMEKLRKLLDDESSE